MKQRMITVVYGIALLIIVLLFYNTMVLNAGIAVVTALGAYEIFAATKSTDQKELLIISIAFAAIIPFMSFHHFKGIAVMFFFGYMFVVFCILLWKHRTVKLEKIALCILMTVLFTSSMSCIIVIRDQFKDKTQLDNVALFFIALVFVAAWITDGGGYIFGRLFGKHKMSPEISPKKTVEGAVGGIVSTVIFCVLLLFIYNRYLLANGVHATYNYLSVTLLGLVCSVVSIIGDLSASLIKRENGIKDFGKVLPGHGGVLDRFDSLIFVAPLILGWVYFFPIVAY